MSFETTAVIFELPTDTEHSTWKCPASNQRLKSSIFFTEKGTGKSELCKKLIGGRLAFLRRQNDPSDEESKDSPSDIQFYASKFLASHLTALNRGHPCSSIHFVFCGHFFYPSADPYSALFWIQCYYIVSAYTPPVPLIVSSFLFSYIICYESPSSFSDLQFLQPTPSHILYPPFYIHSVLCLDDLVPSLICIARLI